MQKIYQENDIVWSKTYKQFGRVYALWDALWEVTKGETQYRFSNGELLVWHSAERLSSWEEKKAEIIGKLCWSRAYNRMAQVTDMCYWYDPFGKLIVSYELDGTQENHAEDSIVFKDVPMFEPEKPGVKPPLSGENPIMWELENEMGADTRRFPHGGAPKPAQYQPEEPEIPAEEELRNQLEADLGTGKFGAASVHSALMSEPLRYIELLAKSMGERV